MDPAAVPAYIGPIELDAFLHRSPRRLIVKIWPFIEAHHRDLGAALFVIPPSLCAMAFAGAVYAARLLFG
jgi:hypothetical protein